MTAARLLYALGVLCAALVGFCSPYWYLGFAALAVGFIWAAYDLVDVKESDGKPQNPPSY
jgi:hypothetical protein